MRLFTIFILTALGVFGCTHQETDAKTSSKKGASMIISTVSFSGSNPSMGPHSQPSKKSLNMKNHGAEASDLLDNTKVNDQVTLREYIQLHIDKKADEIQKINQAYKPNDVREGQRIVDLNISLENGPTVTLSDLRYFSLTGTGYANFEKLIGDKGTVSKGISEEGMKLED